MKAGFIGLGVQGKYLAINQARAGIDLIVYDVRPEPLKDLAETGARIASSAAEVGRYADIVQICVLDDAQLESVMLGEAGVLAGSAAGKLVVVHSTVRPSTIARLAERAAEKGVELMDVPVSGSENGARNKTMSYMAGGSAEGLARCRPLFETSGSKILHTGGLGTGIRAKLAHQLIICINILAAYEGMMLGEAAGVARDTLIDVVREGMAQSRVAERWKKVAFSATSRRVFYKDLQLCLEYGHELGLSLPGAALAQQMIEMMVA
jgi:3-hydroxyisobutyrate dehydrogenase-like beta-hydroxyacid dehydrogenase